MFNTVNMHVYHYAGNNPVKYVDPDGREQNLPQKFLTSFLSFAAKNEKVGNFVRNHTSISIQRSSSDNGNNGQYFKSTESIKFMGIPLNSIPVQSTADHPKLNNGESKYEGRTIPSGEYNGTLLNKSGSYLKAISITGNGVAYKEAVLCHPNCKTAKGNTTEYANGKKPYSLACQISHLADFDEVTNILIDIGFEYGKNGKKSWVEGDKIKIIILEP